MKSLMFVLSGMVVVFLAMASSAYSQGVPDTLENRRIAADGIRELAALRPEGQRDEAVRLMRALVRPDRMRLIMMEAMLKRFTAQELDALAGFYGSEVGRSIVKKFGVYMADIQPHIQAEFARVLRELELQSR